ncbi:hypothetical protein [Rhodoferax sp.]|uniref:hypothetical protein n=1 Tax=Rhodoferax sp. TaxID=50421 RepID=UPI00262B6F81|nr:hypothetical protein [Rhodoferax sp.]MDD2926484.1 hypothetical protein [Rhodoferax sp.]
MKAMQALSMKLSGVHGVQAGPTGFSSRSARATSRDVATSASATVSLSEAGKSLADIMAGVNLRHIRYTELVEVAQRLRDAGHLEGKDYLDFIGPSPAHARLDETTDPDWNRPMDRVGMHEMQLEFMQATGSEQRFIDFERYLLDLYLKFAT